jgi:predicted nuclease of predicted toxin-antitoxin system
VTSFYIENGVGKRIVDAINLFAENHGCEAVIQHEVHPQIQLPQQGDEWWIEEATNAEFVIVTKDLDIFRTASERATVERTRARVIGFARANYSGWQMLAGFASHWSAIEEHLAEPGPWILKVYAGPTAPILILGERLDRR